MSNDGNRTLEAYGDSDRNGIVQGSLRLTVTSYMCFADLIDEAQSEEIGHSEFIERAEAIHPQIGEAAHTLRSSEVRWMAALAIRMAVLDNPTGLPPDISINRLQRTLSRCASYC